MQTIEPAAEAWITRLWLHGQSIKIWTTIESNVDNIRLQRNIDMMVQWANIWQLTISIKKCQTMHISRKRDPSALKSTFLIDSSPLPDVDTVRDLGVEVDSDLKFSVHISHAVRKATTRCYLLSRCFTSRHTATLVKAFKVYVRPILEYCSSVWSPHLIKDIESLESVQRRFTKRLPGLWNTTYTERLNVLGLERLDVRRLRLDLILAYKMMFGLVNLDSSQFFQLSHNTKTRGHEYKLYTPAVHSDLRKYFFANRIIHVWNDIPQNTDFSSLRTFKSAVYKLDLTKYCINLK